MTTTHRHLILLIIFLLIGAALRFNGLGEIATILHRDEAYYGLDALSLVENPRFQAYFPANTGREGLWMNILAPMVAGVGASPFTLRVTSALIGILTLAASYALGRQVIGRHAVWVVGALAMLYWHVHLSHIGFRVITMMLMGALSFAAILRSHRLNREWWLAGILLGLTLYTYIAARVYVGYAGLWLLWWLIREPSQRRGIILALAITVMMSIPLLFALTAPTETTASISRAAASDVNQIWQNILNWRDAWLVQGDRAATHNLPRRPILDIALAGFAILGLIGAWQIVRQKWLILWWAGLALVSFLPTVLSVETPHFLRGAGLILPLVLLLGAGAGFIAKYRYLWIVPILALGFSAYTTAIDFNTWLATETEDFGIGYDYRVNQAMQILDDETPQEQAIIMPTDDTFHPNAAFIASGMGRDITFYPWSEGDCYLSANEPYTALDLPIVLNSFAARVLPYVDELQAVYAHPENEYNVFIVTPSQDLQSIWEDVPLFGETVSARVIAPTENTVQAGETLTVHWGMRFSGELPRTDYRVLLHLQNETTPYNGGTLYATGDVPLCELAYAPQAQGDVTLIQQLSLTIPDDLESGDYHLAMGFYTPDDFTRLSVSPQENPHNYTRAWEIEVTR